MGKQYPSISRLPHNLHIIEARHLIKQARQHLLAAKDHAANFGAKLPGEDTRIVVNELSRALTRTARRLGIAADELAIAKRRALRKEYRDYEVTTGKKIRASRDPKPADTPKLAKPIITPPWLIE